MSVSKIVETGRIDRKQVDEVEDRFNRPPRVQKPLPQHEVTLPTPPVPVNPPRRNFWVSLLPGLGMFFSMGAMAWFSYSQSPEGSRNILMVLPMSMMAVVSIMSSVMMFREQGKSHEQSVVEQQTRFEELFELKKSELQKWREDEREIREDVNPSLDEIERIIKKEDVMRLWARRPQDPDFSSVRVGFGSLPPTVTIKVSEIDPRAPSYQDILDFYEEHKYIPDVPIAINLRQLGSLGVYGGERFKVLELLYALLIHLAVHHAPHELRLVLLCRADRQKEWEWMHWLKHTEALLPDMSGLSIGIGPEQAKRLLNDLVDSLRSRETGETANNSLNSDKPAIHQEHYILLVDDYSLIKDESVADYLLDNAQRLGLTLIDIESSPRDVPDKCRARLEVKKFRDISFGSVGVEPIIHQCQGEHISLDRVEQLARGLAKHQARSIATVTNIPTNVRLVDALLAPETDKPIRLDDIPMPVWLDGRFEKWSILLGQKQNKELVWLNLLEDRDGPHGLVAGTTGAGKSVLLQSMILALVLTHSPKDINLALIDFKGGSTAEAFRNLPHTVSVITNLQGRLVDRSLGMLKAEAAKRQALLKKADAKDIATYHARQALEDFPSLPRLVVVIDEFAEMAKAMPSFMDEINSIAAIGRSLGMHLILATQKPAGVVSDKVLANLKFRVCLRVADPIESRDMLGIPDAAYLPSSVPGRAYIRAGSERPPELFQAANSVYPYRQTAESLHTQERAEKSIVRKVTFTGARRVSQGNGSTRAVAGLTEMEALVSKLSKTAEPTLRWPDPLPSSLPIEQIWQDFNAKPAWRIENDNVRFIARDEVKKNPLRAVIGLLDDPSRQERRPFTIDLTGKHYLIVGAPRSGRSVMLQTLIRTLLQNTQPSQLTMSLVDFGGQNLSVFHEAPHVSNVFDVNTPLHLRRFLNYINDNLDDRAQKQTAGQLDDLPQQLYVIDGFAGFKALFPDDMGTLARVARDGLSLGVHLVMTTDQLLSIPLSIRSNLGGRLALNLSDTAEYFELVGRFAGAPPDALPGRGLVREQADKPALEFQVAFPLGQKNDVDTNYIALSEREVFTGLRQLCKSLSDNWLGQRPEPIYILDAEIEASDLPDTHMPAGMTWGRMTALPELVIGKGNRNLDWAPIKYGQHGPHFLVCGPPQSGKTNLLRLWVWNLCERYSPDEVQFTLIGMRNESLNDLGELGHVQRVVDTEFRLDGVLDSLAELAEERYKRLKELAAAHEDQDMRTLSATLGPVHIVVIDDFSAVRFTNDRQSKLSTFTRYGEDTRTFLLLSGASTDLLDFSNLLTQLKRGRSAFMLQPGELETRATEVHLSTSAQRQEYPVGRGYLVLGNKLELVQTLQLDGDYLGQRMQLLKQRIIKESLLPQGGEEIE